MAGVLEGWPRLAQLFHEERRIRGGSTEVLACGGDVRPGSVNQGGGGGPGRRRRGSTPVCSFLSAHAEGIPWNKEDSRGISQESEEQE
jgi:hypothetical protein